MSDNDVRPRTWGEYIGQERLKDRLEIHIAAALGRDEQLDHILLVGPPGCGKTTLAALIAERGMMHFVSYIMPIKPIQMKRLVYNHQGLALFDEIHRLSTAQQETLLPLIEDHYLQLETGEQIENELLTIVGATTEPQGIIKPLWDRFQIKPIFEDYSDDEMALIVQGMATKMGTTLPVEAAKALGRAAGGIPRQALSFVHMARDLDSVDPVLIFEKCGVTKDGLDRNHMRYIDFLLKSGGTAGLDLISTHLGLPKSVVADMEKLLVKRKVIEYTSAGRSALGNAYHLMDKKR